MNMPLYRSGQVTKCRLYFSRNMNMKVLQLIPLIRDIQSPVTINLHLCYLQSATFPSLTSSWWSSLYLSIVVPNFFLSKSMDSLVFPVCMMFQQRFILCDNICIILEYHARIPVLSAQKLESPTTSRT